MSRPLPVFLGIIGMLLAAPLAEVCAADLASAAEVYAATYDNAPTNRTFDFTATVALPPIGTSLPVVDDKGFACVYLRSTAIEDARTLRAGDRIRLTGGVYHSDGNGNNYAQASKIALLGHGEAPKPLRVSPREINSPDFCMRVVTLKGFIADVFRDEIDPSFVFFVLSDGSDSAYLTLSGNPTNELPSHLVGATVEVAGIVSVPRPNTLNRKVQNVLVIIRGIDDIKITASAPGEPSWRRGGTLRHTGHPRKTAPACGRDFIRRRAGTRHKGHGDHQPARGGFMNTTVMLIDDHAIVRMGLKSLLDTYADIKVVADAEGGEETVRTALAKKPDVIVMDLMMPIMDGTESTRRILAEWPDAKILILTTYGTADAIGHTLEAGAKGAMMKNAELDELVAAIKKVARGERFIDAEISQMLSENPPIPELSPRQRQILESVTRGLSNEEIAKMLGIGLSVEKEHVRATFAKIGAANRSEAVAIALRKHLLKI